MGADCCSTDAEKGNWDHMPKAQLPANFKGSYGTMYYVNDMKKSIAFYKETIGLTPQFESEGWTQFDLNGHALCLHSLDKTDSREATVKSDGGGTLILLVDDIQKVVGRLKEKRVTFTHDIIDMGEHGFCANFKDLDGYELSVYQYPAAHAHK